MVVQHRPVHTMVPAVMIAIIIAVSVLILPLGPMWGVKSNTPADISAKEGTAKFMEETFYPGDHHRRVILR